MPKGVKAPQWLKDAVLNDYYSGEKTIWQIAAEYGIGRRRIYEWRDQDVKRNHITRSETKGIRLNLDEAELILLMILECDPIIHGKDRALMRGLEEKLLMISDQLTEIKTLKGEETVTRKSRLCAIRVYDWDDDTQHDIITYRREDGSYQIEVDKTFWSTSEAYPEVLSEIEAIIDLYGWKLIPSF